MRTIPLTAFLTGFAVLAWPDCISVSGVQATGVYLGHAISTTVDSRTAKALIENVALADSLFSSYDGLPLTTNLLRRIHRDYSYDVAALYFLRRAEKNNPVEWRLFDSLQKEGTVNPGNLRGYTIVFIPGLGYRTDTATGADFARQRRLLTQLGIDNILVETEEWGLVEPNAAIIRDAILAHAHRELILVSASKGGLETFIALHELADANVRAWINIGGILHGTPIADIYRRWPASLFASLWVFFRGGNREMIEDLSYQKRNETFPAVTLPPHIKVIHYVGVPLASHVTADIEDRFCDLLEFGPNDGLTPVADVITPHAVILPEAGLDHYFRDPHIDRKTVALAQLTAHLLEQNVSNKK